MQLDCPRCTHALHYDDRPPRFCSNCGHALSDSSLEATTPGGGPFPFDPQATIASPPRDAASDPPPSIGNYRLLRTIGAGGMGTVYEAEDVGTGRHVALKLIRPEFAEAPEAIERFRREGRLASTITHPRCVFVLAAEEQAGRPYIVMELMPGRNLHDLIEERGPLPVREGVGKILDVIAGLQEAHRRGVIHRDVKPSNCFLDDEDRVKVGDFGLAKSLIGPEVLTRSGVFLGTLLFASPEQIRNEPLTPQTDVYSVCATLYYLLTGKAPFEGNDDDPAATLARTVSDPLPSMRTHRPELPRTLDEIVCKGLSRVRSKRWQDLEELRQALLPFVEVTHTIDEVGWRISAFLCDLLLILPIELTLQWLLARTGLGEAPMFLGSLLIGVVCGLAYFVTWESLLGWTPGKFLMRLRVRERKGHDRPRFGRAVLRTLWFYAFENLGALVFGLILVLPGNQLLLEGDAVTARMAVAVAILGMLPFVASGLGLLLLGVTMRRRNGFRGLHERLSGTETIRLPAPRSSLSVPDRSAVVGASRPALPRQIGAFPVRDTLAQSDREQTLWAEDGALGRPVWLWLRREGELPEARHDLARESRPRWLTGGEQDEWKWDAFVAGSGCLLADLVSRKFRLQWADALALLRSLADELDEASCDGTLPATLSVLSVWMQPSGKPLLTDMPLRAGPVAESPLDLLRQVAALALEGAIRGEDERSQPIRAPLPAHASELLERLVGASEPFASLDEAKAALHEAADRPAEISRPMRGLSIVLGGLTVIPGLMWMFSLGLLFLLGAYLFCVAGLAGCESALASVAESGDESARRDRRQFLELQSKMREERSIVLQSWGGYLRTRLIDWEDSFTAHYASGLERPEPGDDPLLELGDDLFAGPRFLSDLVLAAPEMAVLAFAGWPLLWCLWAGLTRGGLTRRLAGMTLRNRNGTRASRWRCLVRSLVVWLPVLMLLLLSFWLDVWRVHHGPDESNANLLAVASWLAWWAWWQAFLLLPIYVWMGVRWPNRGLHDWIAGTYPVAV